jgi:uncharacterized iron-regulated protein
MTLLRVFCLGALLLTLAACQAGNGHRHLGNPELPYPPEREPRVGDILHLPTGIYVDQTALLDQAARNQVVFVGETHDNPASHQLQVDILRALEKHNPGRVSLAMEMFTPAQQEVLDRWSAGHLSEKEFLKEVDWYHNWRMNFGLYQPLLELARAKRIPVIALNAPKELVGRVGHTPFVELSEAERRQLPELVEDPYQTEATRAFYGGHQMGEAALDGFQRVQTLWDEAMAQNLADYLKSDTGRGRQVVVVAGGNHIRYGYGIPRRLFRRLPASYLLVGSREIEIPADKQDRIMDVDMPLFPMPAFQFLLFTRYEELEVPGVKLGIMLDEDRNGVRVQGVLPGSVAERVDLRKDDLLIEMDGLPLKESFDLIYALQQKSVGARILLKVDRGGRIIMIPVEFSEQAPQHGMAKEPGKE